MPVDWFIRLLENPPPDVGKHEVLEFPLLSVVVVYNLTLYLPVESVVNEFANVIVSVEQEDILLSKSYLNSWPCNIKTRKLLLILKGQPIMQIRI